MKIERDRKNGILTLSQQHYFEKMLEEYGMEDCTIVEMPMDPNSKLEPP
jgi:hypothetical protein